MKKICLGILLLFFFLVSPQKVSAQAGGAGINIGPINPQSRPSASDLQALGASWVRFVYVPDSGFNYDSYINELNQAGIDVVMVLNQQTLWPPNLEINSNYVNNFANMAAETAARFGDRVAAYEIWNEQDAQNNVASIYIPPGNYAALLAAAYNAINENSNSFVVTGGMVAGDPNYLIKVIEIAGGLPADGVGVHPYTLDINLVRQTLLNFLAVSEGKPLWITEFGWEVADQQLQADYLKAVYELVAREFGNEVATVLWYTFSDFGGPGFGLVDIFGNPKLAFFYFQLYAALLEGIIPDFEFIPFPIPTPSPYVVVAPPPTCNPSDGGDYDSRPVPCDSCDDTHNYCPSCATSFTVHDTVTYERGDGTEEPPHCVSRKWGGIVTIDPSDTTIPFVGYKGEGVDDKSDYEQKYLADYFEGTNEYYQNYGQYWLDWVNHAGVLRKLTPMAYQDELKKNMVKRAKETIEKNIHEGGVHDYNLNYIGRLCWDAPFWAEALITIAGKLTGSNIVVKKAEEFSNYCLFSDKTLNPLDDALIAGVKTILDSSPIKISHWDETGATSTLTSLADHLPPDPEEENYEIKYQEWKEAENGKWSNLWVVAPLISRDDTIGWIMPYYGYKSDDIPKNIEPQVEDVPHVARLNEATQELNNMLLTQWDSSLMYAQNQTSLIIASPGEKKLLAQASGCDPDGDQCSSINIRSITCSGGGCTIIIDASGDGHVWVEINGQFMGINNLGPGLEYHIGSPGPGGTACINVSAINYNIGTSTGHVGVSEGCCMTLDENGTGSCKGEPYEPPATCGVSGPLVQVSNCELPAITDPNDNDKLCCDEECKINIPLVAVDAWENPEYEKCRQEGLDCKPIPGCVLDPKSKDPNECEKCKDPCKEIIERSVKRDFGTRLLHPYLTQIWEQTGKLDTNGLFNIFRPATWPEFREMDAASEIQFYYKDSQSPEDITPSEGRFYYNYLGGVQLAKEWVTKSLVPKDEGKNLLQWLWGTIVQ
ncbi:MAG TPA: hypothetical protein VMY36_02890 [Patescibacteria group bacterium]|nr:hypothetical protein [Patescibacteria group bacterium]